MRIETRRGARRGPSRGWSGMWLELASRVRRFALGCLCLAACEPPGYGRHTGPDASASSDGGNSVQPDAATDATAGCDHSFRLANEQTASSVWLTGDFVQWAADPTHGAIAFTLGVDGAWTGSYDFAAGSYQYKFIVDGSQWIPDPTDSDSVPDGFGGMNSVYVCTE